METAILIAGPTAGGKSRLALDLARHCGGVIINADSMQVYRELRMLTARPDLADERQAPHRLYGIVSAADAFSVGRWLPLALAEADAARQAGRTPILVGGTGLYLQALTEGMAVIPEIPEPARREARDRLRRLGPAGLHAELATRDPVMAARLRPSDPQRLTRAYEVILGTGRSLAEWQKQAGTEVLPPPWHGFVLDWPRSELYRRCDQRLAAMLAHGALDEVAQLAALNLDPGLPAMKALGVPELIRHVQGEIGRAEALAAAQQATRRYAKRQMTWFRNKMCAWTKLKSQDSESFFDRIIPFIMQNRLTAPR